MNKYLLGKLLFILSLFTFFSCSGLFQYHIYDQNKYQGVPGIIKTMNPLHIDKIDGMTLNEAIYRFDLNYTSGSHADTFYLIPGEHTIQVHGGQAGVYGHTNVTTITGQWAFSVNIQKGHEYRIRWKEISPGTVIAYIFDLTSNLEVGTLIDWETESYAEPPQEDVSPISLRSFYRTIGQEEVISMLKKYDFHDAYENKTGSGIYHQYELKTIRGKDVIIDHKTNLMWHQSGSKECWEAFNRIQTWLNELNTRGYAGFSDWRLPTLEEAASLIAYKPLNKGLYIDTLFSEEQTTICSGDVWADLRQVGKPCAVFLREGVVNWGWRYKLYVRPVRSVE